MTTRIESDVTYNATLIVRERKYWNLSIKASRGLLRHLLTFLPNFGLLCLPPLNRTSSALQLGVDHCCRFHHFYPHYTISVNSAHVGIYGLLSCLVVLHVGICGVLRCLVVLHVGIYGVLR